MKGIVLQTIPPDTEGIVTINPDTYPTLVKNLTSKTFVKGDIVKLKKQDLRYIIIG